MEICELELKVRADIAKNRMHLTLSGNIKKESLTGFYTDIRFCVGDLKPGFDVIVDARLCNLFQISSFPIYKKIIDYLISKKVGEVIRVVKADTISRNQYLNFSKKIQSYKPIYATSIEEAEEILKKLCRRNGMRFQLHGLLVSYQTDQESGKGVLINISTSGCAIESPTLPLPIDTEITIILTFKGHARLSSSFNIKAKIVRTDEEMFAAQFLDLDDVRKDLLYQRLTHEVGGI
jgi:PilZ domain